MPISDPASLTSDAGARVESTAGEIWAVLPVKNIADAKQRLAPLLAARERRELFIAMLEDVLLALASASDLAGIVVVTRDARAARIAERFGAEITPEPANDGHSAAVTRGGSYLIERNRRAMLALPGDIPLVSADDINRLAASLGRAPALSIAPSADEFGSNGVALSPPNLIQFQFGDDSFRPHLALARAEGATPRILHLDGFALDVDGPDDLRRFAGTESATTAYRYLRDSGLLGRL